MSFNPHSVAALAELAPDRPRGLTTCSFDDADWSLPDYRRAELAALADAERTGAAFISHDHTDLANPAVARLKAEGLPVLTWTIRSPAEEAAARRDRRQHHLRGLPTPDAATPKGLTRAPIPAISVGAMDGGARIEITVLGGLGEIAAADWDACAGDGGARPARPLHHPPLPEGAGGFRLGRPPQRLDPAPSRRPAPTACRSP